MHDRSQNTCKIVIAGIGGQGVVFLTNILTEAGIAANIPAASSEIHGIAQRRGSVVAGITFGENTFGFIEEAGADILIGLEPLEAMRCISYLNRASRAVIDDNRQLPHSINTGKNIYPDVDAFIGFLKSNIVQVIFNRTFDANAPSVLRNVYILGRAATLEGFPLPVAAIEETLERRAKKGTVEEAKLTFRMGLEFQSGGDDVGH